MLLGYSPVGHTPLGNPIVVGDAQLDLSDFLLNPHVIKAYLVEVQSSVTDGTSVSSFVTDRYSAGLHAPVIDNQHWDARITDLEIRKGMNAPFPTIQGGENGGGRVVLRLRPSERGILERSYVGKRIQIWVGPASSKDFADYRKAFTGRIRDVSWSLEGQFTLQFGERDEFYDRPIQQSKYSDNGVAPEGIVNRERPIAFGRPRNVPAVEIDPVKLIFEVHDGPIQAISGVFDKGVALSADGDTTDLEGATMTPGTFKTDLSKGRFRIGAKAQGRITADPEGENDDADVGFTDTVANVFRRILKDRTSGVAGPFIDESTVAALNGARPEKISFFHSLAPITIRQVLDSIGVAMGVYRTFNEEGLAQFGVFQFGSAAINLDDTDLISLVRGAAPPPPIPLRQEYARSWSVQTDDELAGAVGADRREFVTEAIRVSEQSFSDPLEIYEITRTISLPGGYPDSPNAASGDPMVLEIEELLRAQDFDGQTVLNHPPRANYQAVIANHMFRMRPGQTITIETDRFGLPGKKRFIVIAVRESARQETSNVSLWG